MIGCIRRGRLAGDTLKSLPFALCASSEDGTVTGVPLGGVGSHHPSPHKGRVAFPQPSPRSKNDVIDRTKFARRSSCLSMTRAVSSQHIAGTAIERADHECLAQVVMATSVHGTHGD